MSVFDVFFPVPSGNRSSDDLGIATNPSLFEKWVELKTKENGRYEAKCKKGNWSVDAPSKNQATQEAMHYFMQYAQDGEYT